MNLPNTNFKTLHTKTEKELIDTIYANPLAECFLVYLRCKYTYDTKWEYIVDVCNRYNCNDILWFNDWYEGQQNIEYLAIATIELPKDELNTCSLCDSHHGCDNCYYGQIDSKEPDPHCEDCEHNGDEVPTQWKPLGDTYCRRCGRKLRPTN